MKMSRDNTLQHPFIRRTGWVLFAIMFYLSGESFVIWLLEPENFTGGSQWTGVIMFPMLFIAFFFVQRHLGCSAGHCRMDPPRNKNPHDNNSGYYIRPPGF